MEANRVRRLALVVDDDGDMRETLARLLDLLGFETREAANGQEALEILRNTRPCLILLDLRMPVMNGAEFREHQLADPALAGIPVIVLSADADLSDQAASLKIEGVLPKPVSFSKLEATIEYYCPRSASEFLGT